MSKLSDHVKLNDLSIPGTHDSIALYGGCWFKTQDFDLVGQLTMGIRYFDIRLKYKEGLFGYHGVVHQRISLFEILRIFNQYLSVYPRETILLCYRNEDDVGDERFAQEMSKVIIKSKGCVSFQTIPTLGESRGKIILIDRYSIGIGMRYNVFFKTCNLWNENNLSFKLHNIKKFIIRIPSSGSTHFFRTALNGTNFNVLDPLCMMGKNPKNHADVTNRYVLQWLKKLNKSNIGIIVMDFPPQELVSLIIQFNFQRQR